MMRLPSLCLIATYRRILLLPPKARYRAVQAEQRPDGQHRASAEGSAIPVLGLDRIDRQARLAAVTGAARYSSVRFPLPAADHARGASSSLSAVGKAARTEGLLPRSSGTDSTTR